MASPIESIGFMHGLHNYPKLQIPGGKCGIRRTPALLSLSRRGRFSREAWTNFFMDETKSQFLKPDPKVRDL